MRSGDIGQDARLVAMCEWVDTRATATPSLVAVRISDVAVTYGKLASALDGYRSVTSVRGMSTEAGVVAALVHCLPSIVKGRPARAATEIESVIAWLSRDLVNSRLAAVG